ncbi:MAG TPA: MCP four helix bundle domain-containing protein, partial [Burkholderiaceae bacterium]
MFTNLKVGTRLAAAFTIVLLLLAGIVYVGVSRLGIIHDRLIDIAKVNAIESRDALQLSTASMRIGADVRAVILAEEPAEIKSEAERLKGVQAAFLKIETALHDMFASSASTTDQERELMGQIENQHKALFAIIDKAAASAVANNNVEATKTVQTEFRPANLALTSTLDALVAYEEKQNNEAVAQADEAYASARTLTFVLGGLSLVMAVAAAFWVTRSILKQLGGEPDYAAALLHRTAAGDLPADIKIKSGDDTSMLYAVQQMVDRLKSVIEGQRMVVAAANQGNFDRRVDTTGLQGFQKDIGDSLNQLVTTSGNSVKDVVRVMKALSSGDLTLTIDQAYEGAFGDMKEYVNATVAKLSEVVADVNAGAEALAGASEEVSATAQSLSQASSEQAAGVEETSASMEQMTASISQNTENAKVTDGMATKAASEA